VLALVVALWLIRNRVGRGPLTGFLYFGGTLVPALGFFNVFPMLYSFVADHFQYLASLGLIVPAAVCAKRIARRIGLANMWIVWTLEGGVLVVLAFLTVGREPVFSNMWMLWNDTLAKNPACWMAHNNLGTLHLERREFSEAIAHFEAALRLRPEFVEGHYNLGVILEERGEFDQAVRHLETALRISPDYWKAQYVMGLVRKKQGDNVGAAERFRATLRLNPDYVPAETQLRSIPKR